MLSRDSNGFSESSFGRAFRANTLSSNSPKVSFAERFRVTDTEVDPSETVELVRVMVVTVETVDRREVGVEKDLEGPGAAGCVASN